MDTSDTRRRHRSSVDRRAAVPPGMLSLKEAAEFLGYNGDDALRQIIDRSRAKAGGAATTGPTIKFFQPSKKAPIRFKPEWLLEFIDEHTVDPSHAVAAAKRERKQKARDTPLTWSHGLNPSLFGSG